MDSRAVPLLPGVAELASDDRFIPGGGVRNEEHLAGFVELPSTLPISVRHALFDPQTSGGLLIAVAANRADNLLRELEDRGASGTIIGRVAAGAPHIVLS
jgi:selenide,water dikinase